MDEFALICRWLKYQQQLGLATITEMKWPQVLGVDLYDFEVALRMGDRIFPGRGLSSSAETALTKASAEAYERLMVTNSDRSSMLNGYGVSKNQFLAAQKARLELIERDLFMCHFLTRTPLIPLPIPYKIRLLWSKIAQGLEVKESSLAFHRSGPLSGHYLVTCTVQGNERGEKPFGIIVGTDVCLDSVSMDSCAFKAFLETLVPLSHFCMDKSYSYISMNSVTRDFEFQGFETHERIALDPMYVNVVTDLFPTYENNANELSDNSSYEWEDFGKVRFDNFPKQSGVFQNQPPFVFCEYSNPKLQSLFLGMTSELMLNKERLEAFANRKLHVEDYQWAPHPFG